MKMKLSLVRIAKRSKDAKFLNKIAEETFDDFNLSSSIVYGNLTAVNKATKHIDLSIFNHEDFNCTSSPMASRVLNTSVKQRKPLKIQVCN